MKRIRSVFAVVLAACFLPWFFACNGSLKKTTYDIEAQISGDTLSGRETVTFFNDTENSFTSLKFNLYANAFRENAAVSPISAQYYYKAYENGESYGNTEIKAVYIGENAAEFSVAGTDENILEVRLFSELFPDEKVSVTIEFTVKLAEVIARTGINGKTVNLANFYPILCGIKDGAFFECEYYAVGDPFFSDVADYKVKFTAPKEYVVATGGREISAETQGENTVRVFESENCRSFAIVLSKDFEVISGDFNGVKVSYFYYADEDPQESLSDAISALGYFSETFGEYPFETYNVVQTKFVQGGMEFTSLVFISDELEKAAKREVIVHETAHQWWQTVVGVNEIESPFIDEGLAEYSVVLFYENHPDYGFTRKQLIDSSEKTYKVFCSVYKKISGEVDTTMTRSLNEYRSEYEYVNIAYVKSCIMFDYLRQTVGDNKFFSGLKRFYDENRFKIAGEEELIGAFERAGADSNGFFRSFLDGKVII